MLSTNPSLCYFNVHELTVYLDVNAGCILALTLTTSQVDRQCLAPLWRPWARMPRPGETYNIDQGDIWTCSTNRTKHLEDLIYDDERCMPASIMPRISPRYMPSLPSERSTMQCCFDYCEKSKATDMHNPNPRRCAYTALRPVVVTTCTFKSSMPRPVEA